MLRLSEEQDAIAGNSMSVFSVRNVVNIVLATNRIPHSTYQ